MNQPILYQIGTLPVFSYNPAFIYPAFEMSIEPILFSAHSRVIFPTEPFTQGSVKTYTVDLQLVGNSIYTENQYISMLYSLKGRMIDFFSFLDLDEPPEVAMSGDEDPRIPAHLLWLHTRGTLQNITPDTDKDTGRTTVAITFFSENFWYPINRIEWVWRAGQYQPTTEFSLVTMAANWGNYIGTYPYREDVDYVSRHGRIWVKRLVTNGSNDLDWMLTTSVWDDLVGHRSLSSPSIGSAGSLTIAGTSDDEFVIDPSLWSGGASSKYSIPLSNGGTPYTTGNIYVTIETTKDGYLYDTELIDINVASLHAQLAEVGLSGILSGDVLYFGDWNIQPGFIVRGTSILTIRPYITYKSEYPGKLDGYQNRITLGESGSHTNLTLNYLHLFRRE